VKGLSNVINMEAAWSDCVHTGEVACLHILPSGPQPQDSLALLRSEKLAELLKVWRQTYDYVLMDTPPLVNFIDAQGLAASVDGTVLVLALERATKPSVLRAMNMLMSERNQLIGLVVNKSATESTYGTQKLLPTAEIPAFNT
jgi:capsular exopolysaccharide synthesis family protein